MSRKDDVWNLIQRYSYSGNAMLAMRAAANRGVPIPMEELHAIDHIHDSNWRALEEALSTLTNEDPAAVSHNQGFYASHRGCKYCRDLKEIYADTFEYDDETGNERWKSFKIPCPACAEPRKPFVVSLGWIEWMEDDPHATEEWLGVPRGTFGAWTSYLRTLLRNVKVDVSLPVEMIDAFQRMIADADEGPFY
jgi:hypothetical protein